MGVWWRGAERRGAGEAGQFLLSNLPFSDICHPVRYLPCPHRRLWGRGGGINSGPTLGPIGGQPTASTLLFIQK